MGSVNEWPRVVGAMLAVLVSILVHELGHAVAARRYGARAGIVLHGMGGLTHYAGGRFSRGQSIVVSLAGPAAGFALAGLFLMVAPLVDLPVNTIFYGFVSAGIFINIVWTLLNLMPVLPLDGGQVLRDVLGPERGKLTCMIGAVSSGLLAVLGLLTGYLFAAIIFGFLAYQNWQGGMSLRGGTERR